ncbi:MAG: AsmA-like C-terminal domain-containing protein [Pelagibacteraceae bacterium]|nr:AsmA-like C-terminal domain-containing protein [Pelagibacteraceae bacterium]
MRIKPGNFRKILLNNVKRSKFKIYSEIEFDESFKPKDNFNISGLVKETAVNIKNEYLIKDINFNFFYEKQSLNLEDLSAKLDGLQIYEGKIDYNKDQEGHNITAVLKNKINSSGPNSKKIFSMIGFNTNNFSNLSLKGSFTKTFNLKLDKTLAIKKFDVNGTGSLTHLTTDLKEKINNSLLKEKIEKVHLKDLNFNLDYKNQKIDKFSIFGQIKTNEEFHNFTYNKKNKINKLNVIFTGKHPIKIPLINYSSNSNDLKSSSLSCEFFIEKKDNLFFNKIYFSSDQDLFQIENLKLSKDYYLLDFDKIYVKTKLNAEFNNDFTIENKKKIKIKGTNFDAKLLAKELSKANKSNFLKNISKNVEIDFDRVSTNTEFPLEKFRLIGFINKGNFEKLSGKSEFTNGKYLDVSLKKEKNSNRKILEIYSDIARPIVNSYKFFDGLRNGNLLYVSKFDDKNSSAVLTVDNFKLIKAPAFAKLLSLADLQGLADTLKGEGITFDTLIIKYETDPTTMNIKEIFMIGPSISILMDGYMERGSGLISLRGTLIPAKTLNTLISKIPVVGNILIGKKAGEGLFGLSFKIKGLPDDLKTTVNPVKTLTPRFITRTLENIKKRNSK